MKAWCSGRGGLPAGGGRGFDSLRPRCRDLTRKIVEMGTGAGQWGPPSIKKIPFFFGKNSHLFRVFFGFNFAECRALGKGFAECPIKNTRQSWLCRHFFWRVLFAECYTRRTICRVFYVFCRVFRALGKLKESGSERHSNTNLCFYRTKKCY